MSRPLCTQGPANLPDDARSVYQRIVRGEPVSAGTAGLDYLTALGIVTPDPAEPTTYVAADLQQAEAQLRTRAEGRLGEIVSYMSGIPSLFEELAAEARSMGRSPAGCPSSEFLEGVDRVNAHLARAIIRAREELLTSQPGPRNRKLLSKSVERDTAAIDRGVSMRTLYHASARANPPTREWVQMMTDKGARVRTLNSPFMRFVLVDRKSAVIQDYSDGRDALQGAWLIRDHAMCGFIAEVFEQYWTRADDWQGAEPSTSATVSTALQRTILRELCEGRDQQQIAHRLGYSQRTITAHLAELRNTLGLHTVHQLVYWWATSDERTLD
ncbi:LuxR C-terminal-related transcriptional regulator [Streptomyces syringium]|uniref:LuxR C-terminal-related transcriptional regulator n=1 Tax=Streptomyces syringium TaxID=76729 RepID=UPI00364F80C1